MSETKINTVQASRAQRNSYHVKGTVNGVKTSFLIDTGAEVSLMSATVPSLEVRKLPVAPVEGKHM